MWQMAAQAAAPVVGGLLGNLLGSGDRRKAEQLRQAMLDEYGSIDPNVLSEILAQEQGQSELAGYQADPGLVSAQRSALAALQNQYEQGGMTAQDRANLARSNMETGRQAQAGRQAILQGAQARGSIGSGDVLASLLLGGQAAADRAGMAGLEAAGAASQRQQDAASGMGRMASGLREQDFGEKRARAEAMDAISRFNAQQRQGTNEFNMANRQRNFQNRMQLAEGKNRARSGQADAADSGAQRTTDMWYGVGAGAGQAAGAYGQREMKKQG